jgi:hypothetical protein
MRKRLAIGFVLLGSLLLFAYFIVGRSPRADGITLENFNKIEEGIDQEQVERILGIAAGDYGSGHSIGMSSANICFYCRPEESHTTAKCWSNDQAEITIWFDDRTARVVGKSYHNPIRAPRTWQRFLAWLGV